MIEIVYKPDMELWQYDIGSIIRAVPVSYFDNDKDAMAYRKKHENSRFWKDNVAKILAEFDPEKLTPLYYCQKCRRLEDGAHRLVVAGEKGIKVLDVRIGDICYKRYRFIKDAEIIDILHKVMKENPTSHKLDKAWLDASANDKWLLFGSLVDFREKSFLDVGCHVGYSCIEAWRRGATRVVGIDIREDVLEVAERAAVQMGAKDAILFWLKDWTKMSIDCQFSDIVMMMGLLHYFPKDIYGKVLKKLCDSCKETLILELRIIGNGRSKLMTVGKQTLPTTRWLESALSKFGFISRRKFFRGKQRELWVCEKR